jgi:hypothetical protein
MTTKKKVISGSISPRWPKSRVVRWLEVGTVPALVGLWIPDWVGGYARAFGAGEAGPLPWAFPPVLTYLGAVVLLLGCGQGIREMGIHFKALKIFGALAVGFAGLSVLLHFLLGTKADAKFALLIAVIGLAAFFASAVLLVTIDKVAEITTETRTRITKTVVLAGMILGLASSLVAAADVLSGSAAWVLWLRLMTVLFGATFVACRYGVHCYKTQRSIGAAFALAPEEQFWV